MRTPTSNPPPVSGGNKGKKTPGTGGGGKPKPISDSSGSVDWAAQGYVTPVRDQGQCGCCWAFSSMASVESALMLAGNSDQPWVSPQNVVDCVTKSAGYPQAAGCQGGLIQDGLKFAKNTGVYLEDNYPYQAQQGSCYTPDDTTTDSITSFWSGIQTTEQAIINQLNSGPVALALSVDMNTWNGYSGGVLTSCGQQVNHGILVVGYGHDDDSGYDYFKIKNSWGTSWGEDGYLRLYRNGSGFCGILSQAYRPTA